MTAARRGKIHSGFISSNPAPRPTVCLETTDSTSLHESATFLDSASTARDRQAQLARLGNQFILQNQGILNQFGATAEMAYDGSTVDLIFRTSTRIGALPLVSPKSGRPDFGLVIQPRFGWQGIGPMLTELDGALSPNLFGFRCCRAPTGKIPPWVLSTIILLRLRSLLDRLERRFEFSEADCPAPRGPSMARTCH